MQQKFVKNARKLYLHEYICLCVKPLALLINKHKLIISFVV